MRFRCYKETTDDWCPSYIRSTANYPNEGPKLVEVSLLELHTGQFRVCVWGGDDLGMEKDFPADQQSQALNQFLTLLMWPNVNRDDLTTEGFVYA